MDQTHSTLQDHGKHHSKLELSHLQELVVILELAVLVVMEMLAEIHLYLVQV